MNSNWIYKKIGDVCTVERGGSPRPIDKFITDSAEGINWIKIGDTSDSMYITSTAQKIIPEGMKKSRYVKPGDFLLSNSMSFGRPYILKIDGCIHDGWLVLRDNNNLFDKRFLYYYLSSPSTYQKFKMMAVGGVVNNLNSEMVRGVEIPIPTIDEQIEISNILDRVNELIANRKQQHAKLDELVKARFVEMFGDPTDIRLSRVPLIEYVENTKYGTSQPPQFDENGCFKFIRATNIKSGHINEKDMLFISKEESEKICKCKLNGGEIIIVRSGANTGDTCVITDEYKGQYAGYDIIVTLKTDKLNPVFLNELINIPRYMKTVVKPLTARSAQPHLNTQQVQSLPILVVDIDKQKEFAVFVEQIDKSKFAVQQSLDKLETLKKSLMQKYFG